MQNLASLRLHATLLAVVALVTAVAHVAWRGRYAEERNKLAQKAASVRAREIEAAWKALPYTNASYGGATDALLAKIDWAGLSLSDLQRTKLQSRLDEVLQYLVAPGLGEYCRLKTEALHFRFNASRSTKLILSGASQPPDAQLQPASEPLSRDETDGLQVTRAVWEKLYGAEGGLSVTGLTGICLENVAAATCATNSPMALLQGSVRKGWTTATEAMNPGFVYPALKDQRTASGEKSLFFQLSFFAQSYNGEKAGPVYLCLGWLPEDQEWALCRMISDSWLGLHIPF
ncbi:MAG: hypothetical protein KIS67_17520 [Verrucomicrobiae bacterium]|nr:hypothetical protein [Verrucomicrobiae bacterium]